MAEVVGVPVEDSGEKKKKKKKKLALGGAPGKKDKKKDKLKKKKKKKQESIQIRSSSSGSIVGDFRLGSELGKGGFGTVYMGMHTESGEYVAVKQVYISHVPKDELDSIKMEIELLKRLRHENIVRYVDSVEQDGTLNIVLEFVENGSLASIVKKFGVFKEKLCLRYLVQVLEGLAYLHDQGVIHRDIKGANILTTKTGVVKLADFGVAINLEETANEGECVVGTPYWMAPEIIKMEGVTAKCDIWSVGCVVIELMTGKPPYFELAPMAALFRIVQDVGGPPLPNGISNVLRDFLGACFKGTAELRKSAVELLEHPWCSAQITMLRQTRALSMNFGNGSSSDMLGGRDSKQIDAIDTVHGDADKDNSGDFFEIVEGAAGNRGFITLDNHMHITSRRGGLVDDLDALSDGSDWDDGLDELEGIDTGDKGSTNEKRLLAATSRASVETKQIGTAMSESKRGKLAMFQDHEVDNDEGDLNWGENDSDNSSAHDPVGGLVLKLPNQGQEGMSIDDTDWGMNDDDEDSLESMNVVAKLKREAGRSAHSSRSKALALRLDQFAENDEDKDVFDDGIANGLDMSGFSSPLRKLSRVKSDEGLQLLDDGQSSHRDGNVADIENKIVVDTRDSMLDGFSDDDADDDLDLAGFTLRSAPGITLGAGGLALAITPMNQGDVQNGGDEADADPFDFEDDDDDDDDFFGVGDGMDGNALDFADAANFEGDAEARAVGAQVDETYRLLKLMNPDAIDAAGDAKITLDAASRLLEVVKRKGKTRSNAQQVRLSQLKKLLGAKGHAELLRDSLSLVASETGLGAMYVLEMTAIRHLPTLCKVLEIMEEIVHEDPVFQETLALIGFIPRLVRLGTMTQEESDDMLKEFEEQENTSDSDDEEEEENEGGGEIEEEEEEKGGLQGNSSETGYRRDLADFKGGRDWRCAVRKQIARIAHQFCKGKDTNKKAFISCGGLPMLVDLLRLRYDPDDRAMKGGRFEEEDVDTVSRVAKAALEQRRTTIRLAVDSARSVLTLNANSVNIHKNELCRLFAQAGMLPTLTDVLLGMVRCAGEDVRQWHYVQHVAGMLDKFCHIGDIKVKARAVEPRVMKNFLEIIDLGKQIGSGDDFDGSHNSQGKIVSATQMEVLVGKLLGCISNISMVTTPAVINALQEAGVIPVLVSFLPESHEASNMSGNLGRQQNIAMKALYHLCRLSPSRQEDAAVAGIVPRLLGLIAHHFTLKQMAMKVFCDLARAGDVARNILAQHDSVKVYLEFLKDRNWARSCITSLAFWMSKEIDNAGDDVGTDASSSDALAEPTMIERKLLEPTALSQIVELLCRPGLAESTQFEAILQPLQDMLSKSVFLSRALGRSSRFMEEIARHLEHPKAIVRTTLLKMLKSLLEHHDDLKTLILQFDLYPKISALSEDRSRAIVSLLADQLLQIADVAIKNEESKV